MVNKKNKTLQKAIKGSKNIRFDDFILLIEAYGFILSRVSGSHHIFVNPKIKEIINIQIVKGKAKPYQIQQFLSIVEKYNLTMEDGK